MRRRSWPARLARAVVTTLLATAMLSVLVVLALRSLPVPTTAFMLQDDEPVLRHEWVSWGKISGHAAVAVIAAEDQKFPAHDGFDFDAIDQALDDAGRGRRQRGASTISQQVAKNLFLWPGHSWVRKGLEAWFTILIEALWPKQRILEVYLNSAEFGRGIWGVEAASRQYFGKPAALLKQREAALLAAVLPSPKRMSVANPSAYVQSRQDWILNQMRRLGGTRLLEGLD
ncbi:MAG: monofunctional biosynthetic peptidoglycan transglycosylase [Pseudomonadota bacterium]|nr:monofunctional biosynthetic peptidoglycan transglycosylase [Pseudomonadota bacterium]